jgi:hypothetical protein
MLDDFSKISYVKLLRPRCWNVLFVIFIYIYIYIYISLSLVIIKDKNRERQTKHRTKMKREKMKKRPNLDFRAPQVAFDFNHCLDFMEYIIFHCCLS